jgi:hypothetical protein
VVKEVAEAIATAHRHGVGHGRLHTENVMVTEAGAVKLIGFVVAAVLHGAGAEGPEKTPETSSKTSGKSTETAQEEVQAADVSDLGALLYAALVGKWPGTRCSALPPAPVEHGHPLRPRQVRAGVPRPLDAICERVLSGSAHAHGTPITTAHEVFAALSDYIGDPGGSAMVDQQQTRSLPVVPAVPGSADDAPEDDASDGRDPADDPDDDPTDESTGSPQPADPPAAVDPAAPATGEEPTQVVRTPGSVDPEATHVGAPVFYEDDAVGWAEPDHDDPGRGSSLEELFAGPSNRTPPAPPVLPEPEAKPLFAPGPPRDSGTASGSSSDSSAGSSSDTSSGGAGSWKGSGSTGTGSRPALPPTWGPDVDHQSDTGDLDSAVTDTGSWNDAGPGKSWLRLAAVIAGVIVLVVGIIVAFNLGRGSSSNQTTPPSGGATSQSGSTASGGALTIASVNDFDPEGSPPEENPDQTSLAVDGNPSTAWTTMTYFGNPKLGGLKSGVGLLVDLGKPQRLGSVKVTLVGSPTSLEILADPGGTTAPTSTSGLSKVAAKSGAGTTADLTLKKPVTTRYFVVWLTSLPAAPGGYQGQIAEIVPHS